MTAQILNFPTPPRPIPPMPPPHPGDAPEVVSTLLLALEDQPAHGPVILGMLDGFSLRPTVAVLAAGQRFALSTDDARFAARCLIAEQAFAACVGVANRLTRAADTADAAFALRRGA